MLWQQRKTIGSHLRTLVEHHPLAMAILFALLAHALTGYLAGGREDSTQVSRQFHFLFYSILGSVLYAGRMRGNIDQFFRNMALVVAVQAGFILFSMFSPEYRDWLAGTVVQGGHIDLTLAERPPGFSTSSGANLSVIQSLGVFSCLWVLFRSYSILPRSLALLGAILVMLSTVVTGRTGLFLSGAFWAGFCLRDLVRLRFRFSLLTVVVLAALVNQGPRIIDYLVGLNLENSPKFARISGWAFEFFLDQEKTGSIEALQKQPVPSLSYTTMVGTGVVTGKGQAGNDSGYIHNYNALGLGMAVLFYGAVLSFCTGMWRASRERVLSLMLIIGLFLIEIKEPFVLKYVYTFFILTQYSLLTGPANHEGGSLGQPVSEPASTA